jgi:hypothetical protein
VLALHNTFGIGSEDRPASNADGPLMRPAVAACPWGLVLVGVFVSVTLGQCGIHSLSFAVGVSADRHDRRSFGGVVRWLVEEDWRDQRFGSELGTLFSSGLIAGIAHRRHPVRRARWLRIEPA